MKPFDTEVVSETEWRTTNRYGESITAYLMDDGTVEFSHSDMGADRLRIQNVLGLFSVVNDEGDPVIVSPEEMRWMLHAEADLKAAEALSE